MFSAVALAACNTEAKEQLATLAHSDSVRVDSLAGVRKELLDEVMSSTQFVAQINTELAKARSLTAKADSKPETLEMSVGEKVKANEDRKVVVARISRLVAKLDSVQTRLASTRARAAKLSQKDSSLMVQVATYEKSVADLQHAAEQQRAEFQAVIDKQTTQIAQLNTQVDTLNQVRTALTDTVGQLTTEKNTVYYVVGTKDELIEKGILAKEGSKRFLLVGSRTVAPARELDPSKFTKIDRLANRTIVLPDGGEYEILSRQNVAFAAPAAEKDGKILGALTINQPEQFWSSSRFLIIVRS
jgi:predicted  nucleic acid-binding Zn-ribbon protein